MSAPSHKIKPAKNQAHDWRKHIEITGTQVGPFSSNIYCLATITKADFRAMKGPTGAILYGDDGNNFKIGFLQSEFDELEKAIGLN